MGSIFGGGTALNDTVSDTQGGGAAAHGQEGSGGRFASQCLSFCDEEADRGDHVHAHPPWILSDSTTQLSEGLALGRVFHSVRGR